MYLLISEDGDVHKIVSVDKQLLDAADDGYVDIIDITRPASPLRYWQHGWHEIENAGE